MPKKFLFLFLIISPDFAQEDKKQFEIYISSDYSAIKDENTENISRIEKGIFIL